MVSGGRSRGFYIIVETILCQVCKELFDAVAEEKPEDFEPGEMWARERLTGICCPNSKDHEFVYWSAPGTCPKCDELMIADGGCINWD